MECVKLSCMPYAAVEDLPKITGVTTEPNMRTETMEDIHNSDTITEAVIEIGVKSANDVDTDMSLDITTSESICVPNESIAVTNMDIQDRCLKSVETVVHSEYTEDMINNPRETHEVIPIDQHTTLENNSSIITEGLLSTLCNPKNQRHDVSKVQDCGVTNQEESIISNQQEPEADNELGVEEKSNDQDVLHVTPMKSHICDGIQQENKGKHKKKKKKNRDRDRKNPKGHLSQNLRNTRKVNIRNHVKLSLQKVKVLIKV